MVFDDMAEDNGSSLGTDEKGTLLQTVRSGANEVECMRKRRKVRHAKGISVQISPDFVVSRTYAEKALLTGL